MIEAGSKAFDNKTERELGEIKKKQKEGLRKYWKTISPEERKKSKETKNKSSKTKLDYRTKVITDRLCEYGCGQKANFIITKKQKYCCSDFYSSCPAMKEKNKNGMIEARSKKFWSTR